eukprot:CAMPEP_0198289184 /NCGR_PEP_ID=MMETSP1449-20131203/7470_1 /TAXON_ID=420275 /ORGANISM="Attheya septentrionalis, Strain CCMP2084" /LENGTH=296 /DNA_ID=CAMNT_0043987481 /DNA_START=50 /DNA_END=940 /DNA_ORIENTATION=+
MTSNATDGSPWYMDMAGEVPLDISNSQSRSRTQGSSTEKMNTTQSKLFVGSLSAAESKQFIQENKISHILTVASALPVNIPSDCSDIQHKIIDCHDHPMASILEVMSPSINFINDAFESDGNVLVHCASGVSRSVAICAGFLMTRYEEMDPRRALDSISSVRKCANPNLGFRRQLQMLYNCKNDIGAAQDLYSKQTSNVVEDTIRQRKAVNDLHARVDEVEVTIASIKSQKEGSEKVTSAHLKSHKDDLIMLQTELDSCLPDELIFIDPPAKMIRKAANGKIERLLVSLEEIECNS